MKLRRIPRCERRTDVLGAALLAGALLALTAVSAGWSADLWTRNAASNQLTQPGHASGRASKAAPLRTPLWGIAGPYNRAEPRDMANRGIGFVLVDLLWAAAEPHPHEFDETYFAAVRAEIASFHRAGLAVVLGSGLEEAPDWFLALPNARFVDQHGMRYTATNEPNLVFATGYRPLAREYLDRVFQELGTGFLAVRVGGGHWNELTYPRVFSQGRWENNYWAFDANAMRKSPVPWWRPGMAGNVKAPRRFLSWYLNSLTNYELWQIAAVRRSYRGTIAVLYGSYGMRDGDFRRATATNLDGSSPAELNGEVQGGYDHARHIAAIRDRDISVWITWLDNEQAARWLAGLADQHGFEKMGENAGSNTRAQMKHSLAVARRYGLSAFMWIRAPEAYCRCRGLATIDQYTQAIRGSRLGSRARERRRSRSATLQAG